MSDDDQASNASSAAGSDDEGSSSDSDQLSVMTPVDSDEDSDAESQMAGAGGGAGGGAGAGAGAGASLGIESAPPQSGLSMQRASSYDVYTPHDVDASMDKAIKDVQDTTCLSRDEASILLRHHMWETAFVKDKWYSNESKMRQTVGLLQADTSMSPKTTVTCDACDDDYEPSEVVSLACGHAFCREDCWPAYLQVKLKEEGKQAIYTRCMGWQDAAARKKCPQSVPDSVWEQFLPTAEFEQYKRFLRSSFVGTDHLRKRWCPNAGCPNLVMYPRGDTRDVTCKCGHSFCFQCLAEAHTPTDCSIVRKWLSKATLEGDNVLWIKANTKPCPHCKRNIEKNQGCNHMTCRVQAGGCGGEFCWLCLRDWKGHGSYYQCNVFDDMKAKGQLSMLTREADKARAELNRYTFYYERYMNHDRARKLAKKHLVTDDSNAVLLQQVHNYRAEDVKFLREGTELIIYARGILKWTYPHAFYMEIESDRKLFEFLQFDVERLTENLHELCEKPMEEYLDVSATPAIPFLTLRERVTNHIKDVRRYLDKMLVKMREVKEEEKDKVAAVAAAAAADRAEAAAAAAAAGKTRATRRKRKSRS